MKGHDAIANALFDQGIDTVFGVLGDANLFIGDALVRHHGVSYTAATHESNAVMMALGYSRASGRLGVATVTHGPALTNTMTALVEGVKSGIGMLLVAGDTPTADQHHLQKIHQRAFVEATGAGFQPVSSPASIAADVARAVRRAHVEHRPIVLNIPLEFEWEDVEYEPIPIVAPVAVSVEPAAEALEAAVGIIASAARPVVLAGRGAVLSGARDALIALADRLGAPLCTSLLGSSYFRGETFDLGVFGTLSTPPAAEAIAASDCIVTFGASLNYFTTHRGSLTAGKRVVQCDVHASRIGSTVPIDAGVLGDARRTAEAMLELLEAIEHQPSAFRTESLAKRVADHDAEALFVDQSTSETVDPRTAVIRLDAILPKDRTIAVDAGRFMLDALTLPVPEPAALVTSHAFGSIGLGTGLAIGAATARPDRPVVLMVGDGGFMMGGLNELHTIVHEQLDVIVVLFNDSSYGAEHIQLVQQNMPTTAALHDWPDFTAVAGALGADAVAVRCLDDFAAAEKLVAERVPGRPVFIELVIDPDVVSGISR